MRIGIYHNQPPGGARRALYHLGCQLASRHEVDVYTLSSSAEDVLSSSDFARRIITQPFAPRPQVRFGLYLNDYRTWLDLRSLDQVSRQVAAAIDAEDYDVVLADVDRFIGAPFLLRYLQSPVLYYSHEPPRRFSEAECRPEALPLSRWERARLVWRRPASTVIDETCRRAEQINARGADAIVTNSHYNRGQIRRYYGVDASVCYLGVDGTRFRPQNADRIQDEILSVGALEPHKGFDFLIRGLARSRTHPRLRIVAGGGHPRMASYLESLAQDEGVELTIERNLSDQQLCDRYARATFVAFTPYLEPFGLVPLEAMASGAAVVGIDEGGVAESVRHEVSGLLVERNERALAEAIDRLMMDQRLRQTMGKNGRAIALEEWSWDAAGRRIESHLEKIAGAH